MYLTYTEYETFGGNLCETKFDRFRYRAEKELNKHTFNRLVNVEADENTKRCMFELVEYISKHNANGSISAYTSVSNDGYSVSYANEKTAESEIYDIIYGFFADTDLMYRGVE